MKRENIDIWLRNEAEKLEKEVIDLQDKILKIMEKKDLHSLDKINKYNLRIGDLRMQQKKLYEMIGRLDEIDGFESLED